MFLFGLHLSDCCLVLDLSQVPSPIKSRIIDLDIVGETGDTFQKIDEQIGYISKHHPIFFKIL